MTPRRRYRIKVLDKALAVLDLFEEPGAEFTITEIARRSGLNKTTVFRILNALEDADYLERATSGYRLGFKLFRLGSLVEGDSVIQKRARPHLEELKQRSDETVHLVVLHKGEALYLDKIEGPQTIRVVSRVGMKLPAHCSGVGKVLLAHLPEEEVDAVVRARGLKRFTPNTITEVPALKAELRAIRQRGYAVDDEEIEVGLKCLAAPVRDAGGKVIAAVSVSGPRFRLEGEMGRLATLVLRAADRISGAMRNEAVSRGGDGRTRHARPDGAVAPAVAGGR